MTWRIYASNRERQGEWGVLWLECPKQRLPSSVVWWHRALVVVAEWGILCLECPKQRLPRQTRKGAMSSVVWWHRALVVGAE